MMKTTKSKKISAVLALVMALSVVAAGCEETSENGGSIPSLDATTTTASEEASETTTVTTEEITTVTTEETTTAATEETTVSETEVTSETSETSETEEQLPWSETEMAATMYVSENCYSRERAVIGSTPISRHYVGDAVEVIAITDTQYYKLAEGGFIHSDYISDTKPAVTEATTTAATEAQTTASKPEDINTGNTPSTGSGEMIEDSSYTVKSTSRYSYNQLSASEKTLYTRIVDSVKKLDDVVEIPDGLSSDEVVKVYSIVYNSEPQLFWMAGNVLTGTSFATISFKTTDRAEIKAMQKEIDTAAASILSKAANYTGTVSKLKVFYDAIVLGNEFSKADDGYNCSIYNGLTGKGALQCAGYAKTMQYLCDLANIESVVVVGTDKDSHSHAWNVVFCENGYYNLDSTWGDPINSFGSDYIQYEFFLVPDAWIHNITHHNVNSITRGNGNKVHLFDPPSCTKEACNYFAAYKKLYNNKAAAETAMYEAFDEAIANGKNVAEIRVTSKEIYDSMMTDDAFRTYQKYCKGKSSSVKQLQRQSSFTAGVYVVHYDVVYN